jgi:PAS domain S-box-containing protein
MRSFRDAPIKQKLTLVIALTSTIALALLTLAAVGYEVARFRHATIAELRAEAQLIAAVSVPALVAGDRALAQKALSALSSQPEIVCGRILGADGQLFAEYVRPGEPREGLEFPGAAIGAHFEGGLVCFNHPIVPEGKRLGTLMLCADVHRLRSRLIGGASILVVVMFASLLVALVLGQRLQRIISDPILHLAELAQTAAAREDYSLRATRQNGDEIGLLVDRFNDLLAQVQRREEGLRASEQRFREMAESIREVFWLSDASKAQMIYISPGYEDIWGRTCESLYASPQEWSEAIHPDDRARVWDAALTKQVQGDYDEEYRIVRPDGSIRWIHDRAFPVRDAGGQVYRVAGIAEDITQRKQLEKQVLEISDREQARIGLDLHDGLCQVLAGLSFKTDLLKRDLSAHALPGATQADRVADELSHAIRMARHLAQGLHPVNLPTESLGTALQALATQTTQDFGVACTAECAESVTLKDPDVATHLYRIAQEAVHNALKHAHPNHISIRLGNGDSQVRLTVADDGLGIPATRPAGSGLGLAIMRYRAGMIGGTLEVGRAEPKGTKVTCSFHLLTPKPEPENQLA